MRSSSLLLRKMRMPSTFEICFTYSPSIQVLTHPITSSIGSLSLNVFSRTFRYSSSVSSLALLLSAPFSPSLSSLARWLLTRRPDALTVPLKHNTATRIGYVRHRMHFATRKGEVQFFAGSLPYMYIFFRFSRSTRVSNPRALQHMNIFHANHRYNMLTNTYSVGGVDPCHSSFHIQTVPEWLPESNPSSIQWTSKPDSCLL